MAGRGEIRYRTYSRCLPDFISSLARQAYEKRKAALDSIRTPDAFRARQQWVTKTFWDLTGGRPERTPLNVQVTGGFDRPRYRVEKLVYESRPGVHVTGLMYIPKTGSAPYPGVLFHAGHSLNGIAAEPYQKCCQGLASLGYLVLAFDPAGQGERTYYPKAGGVTTRLRSADDEHDRAGKLLMLAGDTATRMQTWDAVRSLDVLAAHPQVDKTRLASTGQSGGGTLTMFLAAVDDRLAAAAVSSGNTENFACEHFNPPGSVDDAEQDFIDGGPNGFDRWDVLYPQAPKPLLVTASARDFFGTYSPSYLEDGRQEFARLQSFYKLLGKPESIEWYESPLPHALSRDMRLQIYRFFGKTLKGSDAAVQEPETAPEPDQVLQVGKTGNVIRDFRSKTPAMLAREELDKRPKLKPMAIDAPQPGSSVTVLARSPAENGAIEGVEVRVNETVYLPGYLFWPSGQPKDVLVVLEPRGRTAHWREGDLYPRLAAAGSMVAAFDIRGIGDLSPEVGRGNPFYTRSHSDEEAWAWASLMLGKPLAGQRVTDILAIVESLRLRPELRQVRLRVAALGHLSVPAMLAAQRNSAIDSLYCARGLQSFRSLLEDPDEYAPLSSFVPGLIQSGDLPGVRDALGQKYREGTRWDFETLRSDRSG